jgi:hypothetical protein
VSGDPLYLALLCAAFWVALWQARGLDSTEQAARFVLGLALGAWLARSFGLLSAPLGLLAAAPWRAPERARFLDGALPSLPLAFAAAKLGCVAASCCAAAGAEALGYMLVHAVASHGRGPAAAPRALAGIAAVRLAVLPLRPDARGSAWLAAFWLALAALGCRPERGIRFRRPGSAISRPTV